MKNKQTYLEMPNWERPIGLWPVALIYMAVIAVIYFLMSRS